LQGEAVSAKKEKQKRRIAKTVYRALSQGAPESVAVREAIHAEAMHQALKHRPKTIAEIVPRSRLLGRVVMEDEP
jgi:hypothetical protein